MANKIILFLIIFIGFGLRFYLASDPMLHSWDEKYHALVAKNCLENPLKPTLYANPVLDYNYQTWGSNHVWLHKPPLTLWLIALSLKLFGVNELAVRLPSLLLSSLAVFLTYRIAKFFFE